MSVFLAPGLKREVAAAVDPLVYVAELQQIQRVVERVAEALQVEAPIRGTDVVADLSWTVVMVREVDVLTIYAWNVNCIRHSLTSFPSAKAVTYRTSFWETMVAHLQPNAVILCILLRQLNTGAARVSRRKAVVVVDARFACGRIVMVFHKRSP